MVHREFVPEDLTLEKAYMRAFGVPLELVPELLADLARRSLNVYVQEHHLGDVFKNGVLIASAEDLARQALIQEFLASRGINQEGV